MALGPDKERITINVPTWLGDELRRAADRERRSVSQLVRVWVEDRVRDESGRKGKGR